MTESETVKIIAMLYMAYPAVNRLSDDAIKDMTGIWYKFFETDSYNLVEVAVQRHISTNKWMPSIAEIREQMTRLLRPDLIPPDLAWRAVKDYLYLRDSYIKLPPVIAKVVETIGEWALKESGDGYDKKMFMDLYVPAYEREKEKAMLPKPLRERIEKSDEALGGESLKTIARLSEAREEERKRLDEITYKRYADLDKLPPGEETGN